MIEKEIEKRLDKAFLLCHDFNELILKNREKLNPNKFREYLQYVNEKEVYFRSFLEN